jgi:hypothetical protein
VINTALKYKGLEGRNLTLEEPSVYNKLTNKEKSMGDKKDTEVVILNESVAGAFLKDCFTFVLFAGLMYFNHTVLSGSTFVDVLFILLVILGLITKKSSRYFSGSRKEAIKFLERKN